MTFSPLTYAIVLAGSFGFASLCRYYGKFNKIHFLWLMFLGYLVTILCIVLFGAVLTALGF